MPSWKRCDVALKLNRLLFICLTLGLVWSAGARAQTGPGATFQDCETCPEMVVIPPGSFTMGSERGERVFDDIRPEGPVHTRTIRSAFGLGKFEVTNEQFAAFIDATGYRPSSACTKWRGEVVMFGGDWMDPDYGRPPQAEEPVVCVSWHDAKAYTLWLSGKTGEKYRLPSEAEWEYAAKAGSAATWPWGEDDRQACAYGNVFDQQGPTSTYAQEYASWDPLNCDDGYARVAPIGAFPPNAFGVHDMGGNVWEWAEDCSLRFYDENDVDERPNQVQGLCERRSVKGGSWLTRISRHRPAFRGRDPETLASHIFGFRVARDL